MGIGTHTEEIRIVIEYDPRSQKRMEKMQVMFTKRPKELKKMNEGRTTDNCPGR